MEWRALSGWKKGISNGQKPYFLESRGNPWMGDRLVLSGIAYVLRHGLSLKDLPYANYLLADKGFTFFSRGNRFIFAVSLNHCSSFP
ncbi:MAG: hypothetical protein LBB17_01415 [Puniceicoccales bacterium]|jgi:hypothetical protein|nr:hypothetical protein [Puniceicoccales bacterium]